MFTLSAPAKINLFLHVTGRLENGYHTMQSLMVFTDAGDTLSFEAHDGFSLQVNGPFAAALSGENLIAQAAQKLAAQYGRKPDARITLTKNLPVASGIGGGSSDAAATLKGLAQLWQLPKDTAALAGIARTIGADVPACLYGHPLWAEGIGDKILPLTGFPPLHLVLVNPLVATPTPQVFKTFNGRFAAPLPVPSGGWMEFLQTAHNDLSAPAAAVTPEIRDVMTALENTGTPQLCRMSGSGATCFAIYATRAKADEAAQNLRVHHPRWWAMSATTTV